MRSWLIRSFTCRTKNALRLRPIGRRPQHQQFAGVSSVAFARYNQDGGNFNHPARNNHWWIVAAGLLSSATATSFCEAETSTNNNEEKKEEEEEEEPDMTIGPDDPYYHISDEDEPTDCSMCLTFRQGPCRVDWKRFELCVKDKSPPKGEGTTPQQQPEDPTACMKYAMPFYHCSSKRVNTYLIIGNDQTQKTVIEPLLESYDSEKAQSRRVCYTRDAIALDWSHWETFVGALHKLGGSVPTKFDLEKTKRASAADALRASWNKDNNPQLMLNDEGEPFLIPVHASVPKQLGGEDKTLFMTFALDQNGNLMGDARNKDGEEEEGEEEKPTSPNVDMQLQIVPGINKEITIYGLYVPKDGDFLEEGVLYQSKPYKVEKFTKKAIKKAKKELAELEAEKKEGDAKKEKEQS